MYPAIPADLERRVGTLAQIARVDSFVEAEGPARGTRRVRLVTGGGLEAEIHPDRCLDLGRVTFDGVPVAWLSPTGIGHPAMYEPRGAEWLRTFGGGLLATCGLDTFGPPSVDEGVELGLHGRIGSTPAHVEALRSEPDLVVEGVMRQARVFGEDLELKRSIRAALGGRVLRLVDGVTNRGFAPAAHMILYHVNIGWPLLDAGAVLEVPSSHVQARDADAETGPSTWADLGEPEAGQREQVFLHRFGGEERVAVSLDNPRLGIGLTIRFDTRVLPCFYQWKLFGEGTYVVGLEPANCPNVFGRAAARAAGELPMLAPQESVEYEIDFEFRRIGRSSADEVEA